MIDERIKKLAKQIVTYSVNVQPKEKVLLDLWDNCTDFALALIDEVYKAGGYPFVNEENQQIKRALMKGCSEEQMQLWYDFEMKRMREMDCFIAVRKQENISEFSDIDETHTTIWQKYYGKLHLGERLKNTRWCVLRYPNSAMAQLANMSTEAFEEYYFNVCLVDYKGLAKKMEPLQQLMEKTKKVRITAPNTDITFSIDGLPAYASAGNFNIPDGEVSCNVVTDSANGVITYNVPSNYEGFVYTDVSLTFEKGKIVKCSSNNTPRMETVFNIDDNARRIGEFALGLNPQVKEPILDILFDEKMAGSLHFTPGNGENNPSAIHWDLILNQTKEMGGGEIYFDDVLIRKDGLFLLEELKPLNEGLV